MRYFIGFLVAIGLIILLIVLLFGGSGHTTVPKTPKTLVSYANTGATAQLTIDGPVNAAQNHEQVQITVGDNSVTFEQLAGYDGSIVNEQTFPNTVNSYSAFLHSISLAGFTKGNTNSDLSDDRGYCPLGDRYIYEFNNAGSTLERFWTTTCGNPRTYQGNASLTLELFEAQVPNYQTLVQTLDI